MVMPSVSRSDFMAMPRKIAFGSCKILSYATLQLALDTTKRLMSSPKCRSVDLINNLARPGSNHREV